MPVGTEDGDALLVKYNRWTKLAGTKSIYCIIVTKERGKIITILKACWYLSYLLALKIVMQCLIKATKLGMAELYIVL